MFKDFIVTDCSSSVKRAGLHETQTNSLVHQRPPYGSPIPATPSRWLKTNVVWLSILFFTLVSCTVAFFHFSIIVVCDSWLYLLPRKGQGKVRSRFKPRWLARSRGSAQKHGRYEDVCVFIFWGRAARETWGLKYNSLMNNSRLSTFIDTEAAART